MPQQLVVLNFQSPAGDPLALGSVKFRLSVDISTATSGGVQIAAKREVTVALDANGNCFVFLWPNDILSPSGSVYFTTAYTAQGQPVWTGQLTVLGGAGALNYLLQEGPTVALFILETSTTDAILLET